MKKTLIFVGLAMTMAMMSCTPSIVGTWVEPATKQTEEQGFILYKDGSASSLNMELITFTNWEKQGKSLILKGFNSGFVNQEFSDTMKIEKVTKTELTLSQGNYSLTYKRK